MMNLTRAALLVMLCCAAGVRGATAQMCPPPTVALVLRDSAGAEVEPAHFDSVVVERDGAARLAPTVTAGSVELRDTHRTPVLLWQAAMCAVRLPSVTLWRGGRAMHLRTDLRLQTEGRGPLPRTPRLIVLQLPPYRPGRWAMQPCASQVMGSRWFMVEAGRWQPGEAVADAPCPAGTVPVSVPAPRSAGLARSIANFNTARFFADVP